MQRQLCLKCIWNFEKACVTVKHDILLNKLNHYRVRGPESNLFETYLGERQQHTVDSFPSKNAYITYGVPQECLKTQILTDYINDLNRPINFST